MFSSSFGAAEDLYFIGDDEHVEKSADFLQFPVWYSTRVARACCSSMRSLRLGNM